MTLYPTLMNLRASARSLHPKALLRWRASAPLTFRPVVSHSVMKRRVSMAPCILRYIRSSCLYMLRISQ